MNAINVRVTLGDDAVCPARASDFCAGYDLYSAVDMSIPPHERCLIDTQVYMEIPDGWYGQIKSRSGLAYKEWVDVKAGVIDSDYRGPIGVVLENNSDDVFNVCKGDRIAQLIFKMHGVAFFTVADSLDETERGEGGFGHTGI